MLETKKKKNAKTNNIFFCNNLKTTKFKLQTQFDNRIIGIYFYGQKVEKHKKIKLYYLLFANLLDFIISVFQKREFLKFSLKYCLLRY